MTEHRLSPRPATVAAVPRRLRRVGIQLYTLRDDAQRDLERTLGDISPAQASMSRCWAR